MAGITIESPADIPDPIISQGGLSVTIRSEVVTEEYHNTVFTITPPTSTPNQGGGPKDTWIVNLLRITKQYTIRGYVDATDRGVLRAIFNSGNLKDNNCTLSWDGLEGGSIAGVIEKLTLERSGNEEQSEWSVTVVFTRGSVR